MGLGVSAFAAAILGWFAIAQGRPDPAAAQAQVARAKTLLAAHNASAARAEALAAVRSDPGNADSHWLLAQAMLADGDGIGAEAELRRAVEAGYDARLVAHLRAHALLLQGENDRAIEEAARAAPQFRAHALRIRARARSAQGDYAAALAALDEAVRIAGDDPDVWVDVGRFKAGAGDVLGAIEASERAVKLGPGNVEALVLRAEMVRTQFGLLAALPWFEAALKRDPGHHDALIEYASTLGDAGRSVAALDAVRRAMAARPGDPQGYYLQAVIAARAGRLELARGLLERTGGAIDGMPGGLLLAGALDIQAGDHEQAIGRLRPLIAMQPMNIAARKLLAHALLRTDAARNAIDVLRPVVARADADSYALALAARGFERIGERDTAARLLDRAAYPATGDATAFSADESLASLRIEAARRPGDPEAMLAVVRALIDSGDRAAALAKAEEVAAKNIGAPAAHALLGDMLMVAGRPEDAAAAYRRAADLRFDEPAMLRLIGALDRSGRRAEAANTLALFLSQNPVNLAALRLTAQWQLAAGDHAEAADTLELVRARIGDGDAAVNAGLALAYAGLGDAETAVEFGEAAYALAPSNPAAADAFGWTLFRSGDKDGALELLRKAVALAPDHGGVRWHLAQVYADANRWPEASRQARAALADPRFGERAAASALIARLS